LIEKERWHIGWFVNGVPHGFGAGDLFTGTDHPLQTGWYDKSALDIKQGSKNYHKADGNVAYNKEADNTKKFDFGNPLFIKFDEAEEYFKPKPKK